LLDVLSQADPGIESFLDDVDQPVVAHEIQLDVGMEIQERWQQPVHQQRETGAGNADSQSTADPFSQAASGSYAGRQHFQRRLSLREQALPRLSQPHAPGRAREERQADAFLQLAYRLTDRRRRDSESAGCGSESLQLRDREKRCQAIDVGLRYW
jgi:hypothetical protein